MLCWKKKHQISDYTYRLFYFLMNPDCRPIKTPNAANKICFKNNARTKGRVTGKGNNLQLLYDAKAFQGPTFNFHSSNFFLPSSVQNTGSVNVDKLRKRNVISKLCYRTPTRLIPGKQLTICLNTHENCKLPSKQRKKEASQTRKQKTRQSKTLWTLFSCLRPVLHRLSLKKCRTFTPSTFIFFRFLEHVLLHLSQNPSSWVNTYTTIHVHKTIPCQRIKRTILCDEKTSDETKKTQQHTVSPT